MLSGIVVDERDFDSGEVTVDKVGHGTHVAGIVAYGDIKHCLEIEAWEPKVRLLSAKVMKLVKIDGRPPCAGFADETRVETQLKKAITTFSLEYGCRIFNLSLGNGACRYAQSGQLPWAYVLDELAKDLDIVIVVSAGNVTKPQIPLAKTAEEFQTKVREQLFTDEHLMIIRRESGNGFTVGSITKANRHHWHSQILEGVNC